MQTNGGESGAVTGGGRKLTNQVERVARGEGGVDVAEGGGEAQHLQLRRPQRHEDGHRVICSAAQRLTLVCQSATAHERSRMEDERRVLRTDSGVGVDDDLLPRPLRRRHGSHPTQISMREAGCPVSLRIRIGPLVEHGTFE